MDLATGKLILQAVSYHTIGVAMMIVLVVVFFGYEEIQYRKRERANQLKMKRLYAEGELILDNYRKMNTRLERMML